MATVGPVVLVAVAAFTTADVTDEDVGVVPDAVPVTFVALEALTTELKLDVRPLQLLTHRSVSEDCCHDR